MTHDGVRAARGDDGDRAADGDGDGDARRAEPPRAEPPRADPPPPQRHPMERLREPGGKVAFAGLWLLIATLISLGGAGLVAALDHEPGTDARAELTWAADRAVAPALEAARAELEALSERLDALGVQGRGALAAMSAREFEVLESTIAEGGLLVSDLRRRSVALRGRLNAMTAFGTGAELRISPTLRARHAALRTAVDTTEGLAEAWARLASGGLAASRLSGLLERHDEQVAGALEAGAAGSFPTAIRRLDAATATLSEADRLRGQLANTSDVDTLTEWIRRNRTYDRALRGLYEASAASPDRVTPEIREAARIEAAARELLPRNTDALGIIMADIGQGGLNQAVIGIEQARGQLAAALAAMGGAGGPTAP